jgi:aspartate-semialdehyde dehydrogenase
MKVAVFGATGMVGHTMLNILEERNFPVSELFAVASEYSVGKEVNFKGGKIEIISPENCLAQKPDIVLMSAGKGPALYWAPKFVEAGATVIDNSSAWRNDLDVPLVVPEVNGNRLSGREKLIANPNCATIQLVAALNGVHKNLGIRRIIVTTFQSVSGSGIKGLAHWHGELTENKRGTFYPHQIHGNIIPQCDEFEESGFTKEEMKLINETRKIFDDYHILVAPTCTRVPVAFGHSESVIVETFRPFDMEGLINIIRNTKGVIVKDDPSTQTYPMPLSCEGSDEVFVGRIRRDNTQTHGFHCWIVADNIRKGAATNAIQIAEYLIKRRAAI